MLISWFSKVFLALGLPSLGFSDPGRSVAAAAPTGPLWQKLAGKLGCTWLWDWENGRGLTASSTLGSSFRWNGDLSISLWLAAAARKKRRNEMKLEHDNLRAPGEEKCVTRVSLLGITYKVYAKLKPEITRGNMNALLSVWQKVSHTTFCMPLITLQPVPSVYPLVIVVLTEENTQK